MDDWRQRIRDAVKHSRYVSRKHFRFVMTRNASDLLNDDTTCEALYRTLSIPFTRVEPDSLTPQDVERLLGVSASSIEYLFGAFLASLAEASQPEVPSEIPADVVRDLLNVTIALTQENQAYKEELNALAGKLEGSKDKPKRSTIDGLIDTFDKIRKLGDGAGKYAELLEKAYRLSRSILDNLPT